MSEMKKSFSREMQNLDAAGLLRPETSVLETGSMEARISGNKRVLNFIGNDFLGWHSDMRIKQAAEEALSEYGMGSTSSRSSIGTIDILQKLENTLSGFLGLDDCMVFPSNYLANLGLFEPLTSDRDSIFVDEMCNPGLFDGTRLSPAEVIPYKHRDDDNLEYHLKCSQSSRFRIIATDAVFQSNGECAGLNRIQELKDVYDAITVIDDSLGLGILGRHGKGSFSHLSVAQQPDLLSGTFAYALGNVGGGFVAGDKDLVKWLRHTSRSYILSEPLSAINAAIVLKAIEILQQDQSAIDALFANATYAKTNIVKKAWIPTHNDYPFVSIKIGSTLRAQKMVEYLFEQNILVSGLCYPNTPEGASLIRINLSARHTENQIDRLIDTLEDAFRAIK